MTCIVGWVQGEKIYMGADSAGIRAYGNYSIEVRTEPKIFIKQEDMVQMIFGCTDSFRMNQLLQYKLKLPEHKRADIVLKYMCTDFIDAIRKCFYDNKFSQEKDNVESGGTFLVGFAGFLFKIERDFQVGLTDRKYNACGCGEPFAMGYLHAVEKMDWPPNKKLDGALRCAAEFSAGVRGPFNFLCL